MIARFSPLATILLVSIGSAQSLPSVPGHVVEVYASVTDPWRIDFDANGVLYAGRDATGSGGGPGTSVKLHRIGVGGSPVTEYGDDPIVDPDGVVVDRFGDVGSVGAVLTGGQISQGAGGHITEVATDQTVTRLFGPTTTFHNPADYAFDSSGRLLFTNATSAGLTPDAIYQVVGGSISILVATPVTLSNFVLDPTGRIFGAEAGGSIHIYSSTGALIDDSFYTGLGSQALIAMGTFASATVDVFAIDSAGQLLRIDLSGNVTAIGSGFNGYRDLVVGPDGALYVSDFHGDRILRIADDAVTYCTAGVSTSGCQATLTATGAASATAASGFDLIASTVEGSKDGLFFFGTSGRQANPWGNGTSFQCVVPPVSRAGLLTGTGTAGLCDGSFTQDLNALWCATCPRPQKNPGGGAIVQAQLWYRDPFNTSNQTTSLSNAIEFGVAP